jgi:hypothetical protein
VAYLVSGVSGAPGVPAAPTYVAVMPATGGESHQIFQATSWMDGSRYNSLGWSPDQKFVIFARPGNPSGNTNVVWKVPAAGGAAEPMGISWAGRIKSPQFQADGRRMFFSAIEESPSELWALENFLPKPAPSR